MISFNLRLRQRVCFCPIPALIGCVVLMLTMTNPMLVLADITLPKYFSNGMVLQRNSTVQVWGRANPEQELVIEFIDQKIEVKADAEGRWFGKIDTPDAGGPFQVVVAAKNGNPRVVLSDVMVGEVWICGGQSNMEWPLKNYPSYQSDIEDAKNYPNIRLFTIEHDSSALPLEDFERVQPWQVCSSDVVADFSAVAFFFGRELSDALDQVPIGLIDVTWGGTAAEAWVSRDSLQAVEELRSLIEYWDQRNQPANKQRPGHLFNAMISPLERAKARGVIWYQGESNVGRGAQYATLFPVLIRDWRRHFANPTMPFLFVQLAPFRYQNRSPEALAEIWEAQRHTALKVPHTGMVVTTDVGDPLDIHPENKLEVGRRLAMLALDQVYDAELPTEKRIELSTGPRFQDFEIEENVIRIRFDNLGDGLVIHGDDSKISFFEICGPDQQFKAAHAVIDNHQVIVSAAEVPKPIAVRFAWSDTAQPNLFNSIEGRAHLPASPFRTDDFPLVSEGVHY